MQLYFEPGGRGKINKDSLENCMLNAIIFRTRWERKKSIIIFQKNCMLMQLYFEPGGREGEAARRGEFLFWEIINTLQINYKYFYKL